MIINTKTGIETIPNYVKEEAEATIAKSFSHGNLGRTIRFIATTDSHNDANGMASANPNIAIGNKHCGQAIKYISDRIGLDFIAFLGDATWCGTADVASAYTQQMVRNDIEQFNEFIAEGYKGVPNVRIVGNHDQCYTTGDTSPARLWNSGAYNFFGRYCSGQKDTVTGYGYFDLNNAKVRVIYMNTSDIPSATTVGTYLGVTQEQKNWLCETLISVNAKSDADEWKILILSHAPLDLLSGIANEILIAYTDGGTYGSYTFTNHDAQIISNVHGHVHCYSYGYIGDKIRRFTIPNSNFSDNNHYKNNPAYSQWADPVTYPKTANSGEDTAFSLVTIDLDSKMCYVDNYGAGIDRQFNIDYNKTVLSITNLSYQGVTKVGSNIDTSSISYTINYSDGSSSSGVGNVTVNPTTIENVGNNSVTVSYTENETTVTANITIVGTAHYTNLADPSSADWLVNTRLSTFGTSEEAGTDTTNYIPCVYGDTIRVRNLGVGEANRRLGFYDTDKVRSSADVGYLKSLIDNGGGSYDAETGTYTFTAGSYWNNYTSQISSFTNIGYIRMCGKYKSGKTSSDVIITVNEEIV